MGQVLYPFKHAENKLNLLVSVALYRILAKKNFPFRVFRDYLAETPLFQPSKRIVVL